MSEMLELREIIADRIRTTRESKRLTQFQLAEECNVSTQTIKKIESGKHDCLVSTIVTIAKYLNISCDYVVGIECISIENKVSQHLSPFSIQELHFLVVSIKFRKLDESLTCNG